MADSYPPAQPTPPHTAPTDPAAAEPAGANPVPLAGPAPAANPGAPAVNPGAPSLNPVPEASLAPPQWTGPHADPSYGATPGYSSAGYPPAASYGSPPAYQDQTGFSPTTDGSAYTRPYGSYDASPPAGYWGYPAAAPPPLDPSAPPIAKRPRRGGPVLITALVAALVGGGVGAGTVAIADRNGNSTNTGIKITNDTGVSAAKTDGTIGAAADKIRPSVVTINVSSGNSGGTGSGVILRQDGYILTNDHVVSLAASGGTMTATLSDGRTAPATIVGRDTSDDLAVIKVSGLSNLTSATFAKSSSLTVGQTVVAVGAPLGLSDTVTSGIVSNTARPVRSGDNDQAVFQAVQTDAAINPGNSGGPLVDLNGSVVGINAAIATDNSGGGLQIPGQTQQSGSIGIGFAIPSDEASRVAGELIANGKAYHAILGVSVKSSASSTSAGVSLSAVSPDGAGANAGLKVGDLVTAVNDVRVTTADSLIATVRSHAPGEQVKVTYTRNGSSASTTVTLGKSST
ncbi:trypsin-like peptidase domain-containing protein [soil metagenome]